MISRAWVPGAMGKGRASHLWYTAHVLGLSCDGAAVGGAMPSPGHAGSARSCLRTLGAVLALLVAVGCDSAAAPDPEGERSSPAPTASAAAAAPALSVIKAVTWPPDSSVDEAMRATLSDEARAAVAGSPVPVLVPSWADWERPPKVMVAEHWFAFSGATDGLTLAVQGSRLARRYEGIGPTRGSRLVRGQPGFVTADRRIWSASWIEGGVSYTLDVECANAGDPRCADDRFVVDQAESLTYVGGHRAGGRSR